MRGWSVAAAPLAVGEQGERVVERAGFVLGLRRRQRALARGAGARASASAARSRNAAAAAKPPRACARPAAALQVGGDALVGAVRRLGRCQARRSGSTSASVAPANARCTRRRSLRRCRPVDRRAHKRMAEAHPGADLEQPGRLGRLSAAPVIAEPLGRAPQQRRIAGRLGRRDQQQPLGRRSGSARSRCRKLSSIRPASDTAPGKPKPPASCAGDSPRGSSSNASGLPRVSATS